MTGAHPTPHKSSRNTGNYPLDREKIPISVKRGSTHAAGDDRRHGRGGSNPFGQILWPMRFGRLHHHFGTDVHAGVEVDRVVIRHADAATRNVPAESRGLI